MIRSRVNNFGIFVIIYFPLFFYYFGTYLLRIQIYICTYVNNVQFETSKLFGPVHKFVPIFVDSISRIDPNLPLHPVNWRLYENLDQSEEDGISNFEIEGEIFLFGKVAQKHILKFFIVLDVIAEKSYKFQSK